MATRPASGEPPAPEPQCEYGMTVRWCPRCGKCSCPYDESPDGWTTDPKCPIHGDASTHQDAPPPPGAGALEACPICRMQGSRAHWAWHRYCRGELNPVAFLGFLDRMPQTPEVERIRTSMVALTGMDVDAARAALARLEERR